MTERGLPTVDGALACPFVAFEDDRDSRATGPDHQHRCYAEVRPAPRALAHQQAYCLSSAFAVCPTFQDWARREAAQARSDAAAADAVQRSAGRGADREFEPISEGTVFPADEPGPQRNPPRDWTSPPPWMNSMRDGEDSEAMDEDAEVAPIPARGGGLAGSFADRIAAESSPAVPGPVIVPPARREPAQRDAAPVTARPPAPDDDDHDEDTGGYEPTSPAILAQQNPSRRPRPAQRAQGDRIAPSWERPPRREAYPTLKTRMGLAGVSLPPLLVGVIAVLIAAVALFSLPALLGIGNPPASATPHASSVASGSASATPFVETPVPEPTAQIYIIQGGDTMSKVANRFAVPLQVLCDANKSTIPNCDKVTVGQAVIIPTTAPTTVPDAGSSPVASAAP